jgi:hypothetical protein
LTFINPDLMPNVPPAMANLAKCRGSGTAGCPPAGTRVIFSIGGYSYSLKKWPWLASVSAAESMAAEVASWDTKYGCDGVDLDIEEGAGSGSTAANALVAFAKKLHSLNPSMIITQPVYGYPQVDAENAIVNAAFTADGKSVGFVDSVGIMVYSDLNSLIYVKDYENGTSQWVGFPITVDVPSTCILTGIQGNAASSPITQMASAINSGDLGGIMVWFASVYDATRKQKALSYGNNDATPHNMTTGPTWKKALQSMQQASTAQTPQTPQTPLDVRAKMAKKFSNRFAHPFKFRQKP